MATPIKFPIIRIDMEGLASAVLKLVQAGDLHVTSFTPPSFPDGTLALEFKASSPTAWDQLRLAADMRPV